jgi:CubicO group peptidase (beta-lactamase class C family)
MVMPDEKGKKDGNEEKSGYRIPLRFEQTLQDLMQHAYIPGISAAIVADGKLAWNGVMGVADTKSNTPVAATTVFEAASLSKPVFAYLVLKLVSKGILTLDQPLHEVLPYPRFNNHPHSQLLTARLVLSHQTGLPNWADNELRFNFKPGDGYGYSGEGYLYLQRVIEKLTGKSLEVLAEEFVFIPLKMKHSGFKRPADSKDVASNHDHIMRLKCSTSEIPGQLPVNAAGSLHTTASDYAIFICACLGEKLEFEPLVSMTKAKQPPANPVADADLKAVSWGLGWGLQHTEQGILAFHWGDNTNAKSFVVVNLKQRSAMVYFANSENGLAIAPDVVANSAVGDLTPAVNFLFNACGIQTHGALNWKKHRAQWIEDLKSIHDKPFAVAEEKLSPYVGNYGNYPLKINLNRGELQIEIGNGGFKYKLIPIANNQFLDVDRLIRLEFKQTGDTMTLTSHFMNGNSETLLRNSKPQHAPHVTKAADAKVSSHMSLGGIIQPAAMSTTPPPSPTELLHKATPKLNGWYNFGEEGFALHCHYQHEAQELQTKLTQIFSAEISSHTVAIDFQVKPSGMIFLTLKTKNMAVEGLEKLLISHKDELALVEITSRSSNMLTFKI